MTPFDVPTDLHPLLARLVAETGASVLDSTDVDAWAGRAGPSILVFADVETRWQDMLTLAELVPELHATAGQRFRVALLRQGAASRLALRLAFAHWPACVMLRDGHYLGALDAALGHAPHAWATDRLLQGLALPPPESGGWAGNRRPAGRELQRRPDAGAGG